MISSDNLIDVLANTHDHNEVIVALTEVSKSNDLDTRLRNFVHCLLDAAQLGQQLVNTSSNQILSVDEDTNVKVDFKVIQFDYTNEIIEILDGWFERNVYGDSTHINSTISALIVLFYTTGQHEIGRSLDYHFDNKDRLSYPLYLNVVKTYDQIERINMYANQVNEEIDEAIINNKFAQIFTHMTQSYLLVNKDTCITFIDDIDNGMFNITYNHDGVRVGELTIKFKLVPEAKFGDNSAIINLGNMFGVYSNYDLGATIANSDLGKAIKQFDKLFDDSICGFLSKNDMYQHLAFDNYKAFKTTSLSQSEISKYCYKSGDAVCADINEYKIRFLENIDEIFRQLIIIFSMLIKHDIGA